MTIETDNELNFSPEEVEWGVNQAIERPQVGPPVPILKQIIYAFVTVFLIGAASLAVPVVLELFNLGIPLVPQEGEHQQAQEIQQPINRRTIAQQVNKPIPQPIRKPKPVSTNRPVFIKTLQIDGMTARLDKDGNVYGPLPEHLGFGHNMSPMRVFDTPGGRVTAVFPTGTLFVITKHTYQTHWRWVVNFDGHQGYARFSPG